MAPRAGRARAHPGHQTRSRSANRSAGPARRADVGQAQPDSPGAYPAERAAMESGPANPLLSMSPLFSLLVQSRTLIGVKHHRDSVRRQPFGTFLNQKQA